MLLEVAPKHGWACGGRPDKAPSASRNDDWRLSNVACAIKIQGGCVAPQRVARARIDRVGVRA